jgi:hypothetical protein
MVLGSMETIKIVTFGWTREDPTMRFQDEEGGAIGSC